jgi:ubiquinone/menaquinone biosynthesis C-methylase UbiE
MTDPSAQPGELCKPGQPGQPGGNPLSAPEPWNAVAADYLDVNLPLLGMFSEAAMEQVQTTPSMRVLDVAAGPGTLACRIAPSVERVDAIDFSPEMLGHCLARVAELGLTNLYVQHGDAQALPFPNATFDLGFCMFGIMFFPDRPRAFRELCRVLRPGGRAMLTSWAPIERSSYMQTRVNALRAADPSSSNASEIARNVLTLEDPDLFAKEMHDAGFADVSVQPMVREREFADADELFRSLTRGNAPFELLRRTLGESTWQERLRGIRRYLETLGPFPLRLELTAWLGQGRRG